MGSVRRVSGSKIRKFREDRKLLQHDLASRLRGRGYGTTQAQISRWEAGQEPRAYVLSALAAELGVKVDDLYGDEDAEAASMAPLAADTTANLADALHAYVTEKVDAAVSAALLEVLP